MVEGEGKGKKLLGGGDGGGNEDGEPREKWGARRTK